jgi:hypothetical protein
MPAGAYCKVGLRAVEGDVVSWNGSPARLVKRGDWLFAVPIDVGPTRVGRSSGGAPPTRNSDTAIGDRSVVDAAWRELQEATCNAWRTS